jgi:hypothetical protein
MAPRLRPVLSFVSGRHALRLGSGQALKACPDTTPQIEVFPAL